MNFDQIKYNSNAKIGTKATYFTSYSGVTELPGTTYTPCFAVLDSNKIPYKIIERYEDGLLVRNQNNTFSYNYSLSGNIVSGYYFEQTNGIISASTKSLMTQSYRDSIKNLYNNNKSTNNFPISIILFQDVAIDENYINFNAQRTQNIIHSLNIYNTIKEEWPISQSQTGVVMGTLMAKQKYVKNEDGSPVLIPLTNTPVIIFNPSDKFPDQATIDEDGNRLRLNIKENIINGNYFNSKSIITDYNYLKDTESENQLPEYYKYSTITNDRGEFILPDIPIGEQTLMFEVDLLKQGLTHDEVALNYYPYPSEENPNVDNIPHYHLFSNYITVIPSWGSFQTGYTEVNFTVDLDLRKWTTYIFSPVCYKTNTLEELMLQGINNPLSIFIRDMTKELSESLPMVELVEIPDIFDRNSEQEIEWYNEYAVRKNKAQFNNSNYHAIKLPANLYDPKGINSKGKKGVWLSAYQFKMFYNNPDTQYLATGFDRNYYKDPSTNNTISVNLSNFDLNKNFNFNSFIPGQILLDTKEYTPPIQTKTWPYEKPWTINYPEPYIITKKPVVYNNKISEGTYWNPNGFPKNHLEPKFLDGDMVGGEFMMTSNLDMGHHGYGIQTIGGYLAYNQFSREVTNGMVYKYEAIDQWEECYSNGYNPTLDISGTSKINGERWQRLECGYMYWLKPEAWPRIENRLIEGQQFDVLLDSDHIEGAVTPPEILAAGESSHITAIFKSRENILLRLDGAAYHKNKKGAMDIYRVEVPDSVNERLVPPQDNFVNLDFQTLAIDTTRKWIPLFEIENTKQNKLNELAIGQLTVANLGTNKIVLEIDGISNEILPGINNRKSYGDVLNNGVVLKFPANSDYDSKINGYKKAKYQLTLQAVETSQMGAFEPNKGEIGFGCVIDIDLDAGPEENTPTYYLVSVVPGLVGRSTQTNDIGLVQMNGFVYMTTIGGPPLTTGTLVNTVPWDPNYPPKYNPIARFQKTRINTPFGTNPQYDNYP